jgi:hypothetical protein
VNHESPGSRWRGRRWRCYPRNGVDLFVAFNASITHPLTIERRTLGGFRDRSYLTQTGALVPSSRRISQPRLSVEQDSDVGGLAAGRLEPFVEVADRVRSAIETIIGKIARPKKRVDRPRHAEDPSGKIMRRVVAGISNFVSPGDITTLAKPEIVETICRQVQSAKAARGD